MFKSELISRFLKGLRGFSEGGVYVKPQRVQKDVWIKRESWMKPPFFGIKAKRNYFQASTGRDDYILLSVKWPDNVEGYYAEFFNEAGAKEFHRFMKLLVEHHAHEYAAKALVAAADAVTKDVGLKQTKAAMLEEIKAKMMQLSGFETAYAKGILEKRKKV